MFRAPAVSQRLRHSAPRSTTVQRRGTQSRGTARNTAAEERLSDGLAAHERIGRHIDGLLDLERGRRCLLLAIAVLVVVLVVQLIGAQGVPHP
jgi:hypothetical protein